MIKQYHAQRFQPSYPMKKQERRGCKTCYLDPRDKRVGTIPVGTILYLQDGVRPFSGFRKKPIRRNPWIVEAWLNREYFPAAQGAPSVRYLSGGHLAIVRSLRDGRTQTVADWLLLACSDAGLTAYSTVEGEAR